MKSKLQFVIMIALITRLSFNVYSANYYVSESGSNSYNGLTPQTAFASLQYAADLVSTGDSVLVLAGNYVGFDIRTNGAQNSPIVFKAIENNVVIDERNSVTTDGINIENADWIVIDGFEHQPGSRGGPAGLPPRRGTAQSRPHRGWCGLRGGAWPRFFGKRAPRFDGDG